MQGFLAVLSLPRSLKHTHKHTHNATVVCLFKLKSDSDNKVATPWLPHYLNWCCLCDKESDLIVMLSPTGSEAECQTVVVQKGRGREVLLQICGCIRK